MEYFSDFSGDSYRPVFEEGFETLDAYEGSLSKSMNAEERKFGMRSSSRWWDLHTGRY